jgi:hypothetical protein
MSFADIINGITGENYDANGNPIAGSSPLSQLGSVVGGASAGAAAGRVQQGNLTQQQDQNATSLMNAENNAALSLYNDSQNDYTNRNTIATKNPSTFAKQSLLASLLSGSANTSGRVGTAPGAALSLSSFNTPAGQQTLSALQQQAITNLLNSPTDNPVPSASMVKTPTLANYSDVQSQLTPLPQESDLAKTGSTVGTVAKIAGAVLPFLSFL